MSTVPPRSTRASLKMKQSVAKRRGKAAQANDLQHALNPDFAFDYEKYLQALHSGSPRPPLGVISPENYGKTVAVIGMGASGMVTAYEAMRMGLTPVLFEANNRIGGRFYSYDFKDYPADPDQPLPIAEMGAMRFPKSGRALDFYYRLTGMSQNKISFPNPGTYEAPGTRVDYKGNNIYYETNVDGDKVNYSVQDGSWIERFNALEDRVFDTENGFLNNYGLNIEEMWAVQTCPENQYISDQPGNPQQTLKDHWEAILQGPVETGNISYDDFSFYDLLVQDNWNFDDIELFGQVGFGTGGWNTDYPNCALELLRVMYMSLDVDHELMLDGCASMPERLYKQTPSTFNDETQHAEGESSVEGLQELLRWSPFNKEVVGFKREGDQYLVYYKDKTLNDNKIYSYTVDSVVYTPHVRVLDRARHQTGDDAIYKSTTSLLDADTWEAAMYQHYMQSTKTFQVLKNNFWNEREQEVNVPDGSVYKMSTTLSDRLTRGTYLVDYSSSTNTDNQGYGCFQSYSWADDSIKFVSTDASGQGSLLQTNMHPAGSWEAMTKTVLNDIYAKYRPGDVFEGNDLNAVNGSFPSKTQKWEADAYYVCAFKNNLPAQYKYQRRLFSQFKDSDPLNATKPYSFILSGEDCSWLAGWGEGAVNTGLNAVAKLEAVYNDLGTINQNSPYAQFDRWICELPPRYAQTNIKRQVSAEQTGDKNKENVLV